MCIRDRYRTITYKQRYWKRRKDGIKQRYWKRVRRRIAIKKIPVEFFGVTLVTAFNTREGWRTSSFELWVRGLVLQGKHKKKFFVELCEELETELELLPDIDWLFVYDMGRVDPKQGNLLGNYWGVEEEPSTLDYERLDAKVTVYRTSGGMYEEVKACRANLKLAWIGNRLRVV